MSEPLVLTVPFGGAALTHDALGGRLPGAWLPAAPRSTTAWSAHMRDVRDAFASDEWLERLAPALAAQGNAAARLARVRSERGVLVTTGQQPGLFGGAALTWSKALSALSVADALERSTGIPTAPLFWAATYDADFAESSVSYVAIDDAVVRLAMDEPAVAGRAMRDVPLGDVSPLLAMLERAAGAAVGREILDTVRTAYAPGQTVGGAFVRLLRAVLEPLGIAILDSGHPAVGGAAQPVLRRALERARETDAALLERESELRAAGYEPTVAHVKGLSLVFRTVNGVRTRIPLDAAGHAEGAYEPNVLLRPVVERAILPTVAYVAGPTEIAYFTQASAAASALDAPLPLVVPRWAGMVIEPHVERILRRYGLEPEALRDPHAADTSLARERVSPAVRAALEAYRAQLESASRALSSAVGQEAPIVDPAVIEGVRRNIAHRLDRLERRVVAAEKRRQSELIHDLAVARAALWPLGKAQERVLNLVPMLARQGPALLDLMRERTQEHAAALVRAAAPKASALSG